MGRKVKGRGEDEKKEEKGKGGKRGKEKEGEEIGEKQREKLG